MWLALCCPLLATADSFRLHRVGWVELPKASPADEEADAHRAFADQRRADQLLQKGIDLIRADDNAVVQIQGQKNPQDGQGEGGRNNGQPVPGSVVQCVAADEGGRGKPDDAIMAEYTDTDMARLSLVLLLQLPQLLAALGQHLFQHGDGLSRSRSCA